MCHLSPSLSPNFVGGEGEKFQPPCEPMKPAPPVTRKFIAKR
jgi:hypothetical protein